MRRLLFRRDGAGPARLGREVLELGEPVLHGEHCLGVVDVDGGANFAPGIVAA